MTTTVTVSEFRNNLSKYLDILSKKDAKVELVDGRKKKPILRIIKDTEPDFDWDEYMQFVKSMKGSKIFTDKDVRGMKKVREATNKRLKNLNW